MRLWSSGSLLDYKPLPAMFESRHGHIWGLFHLRFHFITFGGNSAHLAYLVHKSGRKTSINHHHHHPEMCGMWKIDQIWSLLWTPIMTFSFVDSNFLGHDLYGGGLNHEKAKRALTQSKVFQSLWILVLLWTDCGMAN